jgi:hypothetical protein
VTVVGEVAGLITAVSGLSALVEKTADAVAAVKTRRSDEAKQQAQEGLAELSGALQKVGLLARMAESYLGMHEDLTRLQSSAERARRAIDDNFGVLDKVGNPERTARWDLVTQLIGSMQEGATVVRTVMATADDRYFDPEDRGVVQTSLSRIDKNLVRVDELVASRSTVKLQNELGDLTGDVREAAERVHRTLERILDALRSVGARTNV